MNKVAEIRVTIGNRASVHPSVYPWIRELYDSDMAQVEIDYGRERAYLFMNDDGDLCLQYVSEGSTHIVALD